MKVYNIIFSEIENLKENFYKYLWNIPAIFHYNQNAVGNKFYDACDVIIYLMVVTIIV